MGKNPRREKQEGGAKKARSRIRSKQDGLHGLGHAEAVTRHEIRPVESDEDSDDVDQFTRAFMSHIGDSESSSGAVSRMHDDKNLSEMEQTGNAKKTSMIKRKEFSRSESETSDSNDESNSSVPSEHREEDSDPTGSEEDSRTLDDGNTVAAQSRVCGTEECASEDSEEESSLADEAEGSDSGESDVGLDDEQRMQRVDKQETDSSQSPDDQAIERSHRASSTAPPGNGTETSEEEDEEEDGANRFENTTRGDKADMEVEQVEHTPLNLDRDPVRLREELAEMSFAELQKLKEKVGVKLYRQAMFGTNLSDSRRRYSRESRHRPVEMSAKKPVSRHRQIVKVKKQVHRDPRFDDLSGEYSATFFNKAYSFLEDVKHREKQQLLKQLKKEKDEDKKKRLEFLIKRMTQQEKLQRESEMQTQTVRARKKKERGLVKEGKKPYYLKKSEKKTLELAEKFRELKKSGKVDKYLAKKRKKNAAKDRRKMPTRPS